jgi:hypothetical protein
MKSNKIALNEITKAYNEMHEALKYYKDGINHFYKCINFGASHLDAEAIEFMNQSQIKIGNALKTAAAAPEIIEIP